MDKEQQEKLENLLFRLVDAIAEYPDLPKDWRQNRTDEICALFSNK